MDSISEKLEDLLRRYKLLEIKRETNLTTEEEDLGADLDETNIGVASDGTRYYRQLVYQYLTENGYRTSQEYIDIAAKKFQVGETDGKIQIEHWETTEHTEVENLPPEQLSEFMQLKTLEAVLGIRELLMDSQFKEYSVDIVCDTNGGGTNVDALVRSLKRHEKLGYTLKQMITNELGENSYSVSVGGYSSGTNSTMDQIVLIYERPVWMTDKTAGTLLKDLLKERDS